MPVTKSNASLKKTNLKKSTGGVRKAPTNKSRGKSSNTSIALQQKTRSAVKRIPNKRKIYTEKELDLPKLNTITPAGVQKPKGKKKGKIFVDDQESMMTILAIVNADKEGQIESRMIKARQMEEIRHARQAEAEAKQDRKTSKFEEMKLDIRRSKQKRPYRWPKGSDTEPVAGMEAKQVNTRKKVSFA